jgi:hypothetical protein
MLATDTYFDRLFPPSDGIVVSPIGFQMSRRYRRFVMGERQAEHPGVGRTVFVRPSDGEHPAASRVACAQKLTVLDLNVLNSDAVQAMGQEEADTLAQVPASNKAFDWTHLGAKGADVFSQMVARELKRLIPVLAPALP